LRHHLFRRQFVRRFYLIDFQPRIDSVIES
jgi:hypothetical protein